MRKIITLLAACTLLSSCSEAVKRQAHFIPVFEDKILISGSVVFLGAETEVSNTAERMARPPEHTVSRLKDGSVLVIWLSTSRNPEQLIYIDSGLHPVKIPETVIVDSFDLETKIPIGKPHELTGFAPNTAFIRDHIKLRNKPS